MARRAADTVTEIFAALGPVEGRAILDVGCGHGRLSAALARQGARMTAVDPDGAAVAAARRAAPDLRVEQAGAEALPFADASFDGVVMLNSLHHVPRGSLAAALAEIARVAAPDAPIVIVEPLAEGTFFDAMRPLEDETAIRAAAQAALDEACAGGGPLVLGSVEEFERVEPFRDVEQFLERLVAVDSARRSALPAARGEVERLFAELSEPTPLGSTLRQPLRMHRLRRR
ncbi:SAM-dependent methyltransferase [Methylopila capsulata]|uniref:SAM-dependent methyltransferase n=1 Tax=Methylopila capsulata TaxID=61654 RepID=A0A9W6MRQ0_9HYPH|nr:class I SAM-dependent methyltransferase [Methylopila capsulata]MBM7850118.1 SAM-dependent methyltransferase [Methylopila capsulata]GLK55409.1 ubiquinone/menaquinone biosynthesis methyltransferase [Methylopila capsulata]